jgi:hypothetical protein
VHDVKTDKIAGFLGLAANAHDITTGDIDATGTVFLGSTIVIVKPGVPPIVVRNNLHDVKTGNIAGLFNLAADAHDVTTGDIGATGNAVLGSFVAVSTAAMPKPFVSQSNLHDFKTGNVSGHLSVFGSFHDGNVGTISGSVLIGMVHFATDFHKFETKSTAGQGFDHNTPDVDTTGDGGTLTLENGPANEGNVKFKG